MAATSANFEKGREKHLNEGSGYRRKRMHVPLPAGMGWRCRRRGIIAPLVRIPAESTRVETFAGCCRTPATTVAFPLVEKQHPRFDNSGDVIRQKITYDATLMRIRTRTRIYVAAGASMRSYWREKEGRYMKRWV